MNQQPGTVLLVGAYERENFGDLLFLLQTQHYLDAFDTVASAPFAGQMKEYLNEDVTAFATALDSNDVDAVWVVGGEVGGTSVADAYRMSATDAAYAELLAVPRRRRASLLRELSGLDEQSSPYLPRMSGRRETHGAAMVINSVGLSGLRGLRGVRRDEAWTAVREAEFVSVRDQESSDLLGTHDITHVMAPDFIHTLPLTMAIEQKRPALALIQVKENVLRECGTEQFALHLVRSAALEAFDLRLFSAGSARGHDSVELYREVIEHVRRISPERRIDLSTAARPVDKAMEIATCGLWVGTSLHGLIISSAFDVPRVALELDKLVRYATTWGEPMPYGVKIGELDAAVDAALVAEAASAASGRSRDLAAQADASARQGLAVVLEARTHAATRAVDRSRQARVLERQRGSLNNRFWAAVGR